MSEWIHIYILLTINIIDGGFRFITAMDPLFMALPILENASKDGNSKTLDDIFSRENVKIEVVVDDEEYLEDILAEEYEKPIDVHRLTNIPGFKEQLAHLCEIKGIKNICILYIPKITKKICV